MYDTRTDDANLLGQDQAGPCLPDLLREQVRTRPDQVAVVYEDERLTYRELLAGGNGVAAALRERGVGPDDCVGLFVEPSLELMLGAWGILLAGGAYLPLSPEYPAERLRYVIADSRAKVVFTQPALAGRLRELAPAGTVVVTLEDARPCAGLPQQTSARDLAYVIYTSGSTGKPKGVMIEHRSVVNQMCWLRTEHGLGPGSTVLQKTPMSFDAAQWEILAPSCGSTVVMGRPGVYRDPGGLIGTIERYGVTTLQCVPTLLQALLDTEELHHCESLTHIFSGGEVLTRNLATECLEALPGCELVNLYGPTECTINSSARTVDRESLADGPDAVSIGAPVHNTSYWILDADRSPVPDGEVGELYVGGVQLARGYVHRPDLTAERFVDHDGTRLYRTGDLASWNPDGTVQYAGRIDDQVKLRGFRVELDEIRLAIENHDWVKNAAAVVNSDDDTGAQNLVAFVELDPREAALMDQGNHDPHHQSKQSKLQTKAQLAGLGSRDEDELAGKAVVELPGREPTRQQWWQAFARKTYRFFEGGEVTAADVLRLLSRRPTATFARSLDALRLADLGEILRYFGQFRSAERLLPKYGYASPGSLYATQLYLEVDGIDGLEPGFYYYHPVDHQLVLLSGKPAAAGAGVTVHFVGKKRAIQPVYKNNLLEVLEIEAGHMVGLFEEVLPKYGLDIRDLAFAPEVKDRLEVAAEDYYLGSFAILPYAGPRPDTLSVYVQAHPGRIPDLPAGQYLYSGGALERISDELIGRKHVIAINQQVYERSSLGITVTSERPESWLTYIDLGRKLQQLQMNDVNLGFMSSGYSSKSGDDLPAARRMDAILAGCGRSAESSYFFVGGRVSDEQLHSEGMKEDAVHMKGPTELIRDDLLESLPDYMMPNKVVVLDELPLTPNGKVDRTALAASDEAKVDSGGPPVPPRTDTEARIAEIWTKVMKRPGVSVLDDFFATGGNSLVAVSLVNKINDEFGGALPLQVLFESPTIEKLARQVDGDGAEPASRLVPLRAEGAQPPVYCWPGLGGYTMNLRGLAGRLELDRPFYGVQAHGINSGEIPYPTIKEMAAQDVAMIRQRQPEGPYTLWGYSFGARVAFESAYQLERAGERVEHVFLIAPGSPKVRAEYTDGPGGDAAYRDRAYLTILFSVFAGTITGPVLAECLQIVRDEESFAAFIGSRFDGLDPGLVRRVTRIVHQTYHFEYAFHELAERTIDAPITIFKASGDDYSFLENSSGYSSTPPTVLELDADHYSMLREPGLAELTGLIHSRLER